MRLTEVSIAAAAVGIVSIAGCSATVDQTELENAVSQRVQEQAGWAPQQVACPDELEAAADAQARCMVTRPDGSETGATVTVTAVQDGDARFDIQVEQKE